MDGQSIARASNRAAPASAESGVAATRLTPGLAYGAAGVLLALHRAGAALPPPHLDWLVTSARRTPGRAGLIGGLHGVAAVLDELGRLDEAREVLARSEGAELTGLDLASGLAGAALCHAQIGVATGDRRLIDRALDSARRLEVLLEDGAADELPAGLLQGTSGIALLQLQAYRMTGDPRFLAATRRALAGDLRHCVRMDDGTVQVRIGRRHLFYIDGGSGGIALAAAEYLTHRDDPELAAFIRSVGYGCGNPLVREPGLFQGRAGLLAVLARLSGPTDPDVLAQVRRLGWHAVARDGVVLIPGRRLRRFSADLATGSAGVLLALHTVFDGGGDLLAALIPGLHQRTRAT
jgi:lantibiotic modifying enzyme